MFRSVVKVAVDSVELSQGGVSLRMDLSSASFLENREEKSTQRSTASIMVRKGAF